LEAETAVFHGTRPIWTYREMARRASTLAHGLQHRLGIKRGDRILLWSSNSPEYLEVMFAAWFAGAVIVPINAALHPREVPRLPGTVPRRPALPRFRGSARFKNWWGREKAANSFR